MFYLIMFTILNLLISIILNISNTVLTNILVIFVTLFIYYLMIKKYIKGYGGKRAFIAYHKDLVKNSSNDNQRVALINNSVYKVHYKKWLFFFYIYNIGGVAFTNLNNFTYIVVSILTIIMLSLLILPILIESWQALKKSGLKHVVKWISIGVFLIFVLNYFNAIFFELFGIEAVSSGNQLVIKKLLEENFVRILFDATVLAAIYEELIFRGIFFRSFYQNSRLLAYTVTFLTFGIPHLFIGLLQNGVSEFYFLPIYGLMGVIFAYVYEKTGSIYAAMGTHLTSNLISILAIRFL